MENNGYNIITIHERPQLQHKAAYWFHCKWGIPLQAYEESMQECIAGTSFIPRWYLVLDASDSIIAGAGLIVNDFHERRDLTPNVCALYVEEAWRGMGIANTLLDCIRKDAGIWNIPRLYLITDHTAFYERCGWDFLSIIRENSGDAVRMYTAPSM